ncbi:glutamate ABC transporter permease [Erysipelotrichaceae bacterium]|nr:glutamate ABC transporter permease [Erysipelotrichaceae bacterium]
MKKIMNMMISLVVILTLFVGIPTNSISADSGKIAQIQKNGKMVLGTSADYPPYEFHTTIDGKDVISGFDIEIAKLIADELGVELEIKDMEFSGLLAALQSGTIDIVIAGMQGTEERKKSVDFSIPYYKSVNRVMVRTEDAEKYQTISDLNGTTVGVQQGTVQETIAREIEGVKIRAIANLLNISQDLLNGNIDAMILEEAIGANLAKSNPKFSVQMGFVVPSVAEGGSVAVAKGNEDFLAKINQVLEPKIADGSILQLYVEAGELASSGEEISSEGGSFAFLSVYWPMILKGTGMTVFVAFLGVLFGSILGLFLSLLKLSKIKLLDLLATAYIEVVRGTPILIQIYIIFYGLPSLGFKLLPVVAGIIAITLNSGAYVSEIIRAGINAVDEGQLEAGQSLGMSYGISMREIILPQAIKNILPALGNEFITIIKESSIISIIGVMDIMYAANTIRGNTYQPFTPLIVAAAIYFVLTFSLSRVLAIVERKLNKDA